MEGDDQRRRQYEQPSFPRGYDPNYASQSTNYASQSINVPSPQHFRGAAQGDGSDRFRQAQLAATRPVGSAAMIAGPVIPSDMGGFGYGSGQPYNNPQIQGAQFQYHPDYLHESQRQRHPAYQPHQPQMMYSAHQSPHAQSSYGQMGGYQPGQNAAVEVLSSQFGMPQQYYNTAETTTTSAPTTISQGYPTAMHAQVQYSPSNIVGHSALLSTFPPLAPNIEQSTEPDLPALPQQDDDLYGNQLSNYERAVCETNENTSKGRLIEAGASLRKLTNWLLRRAGDLGLTRDTKDQPELYRQRLTLWDNFNNCWLAFLQRQKDDTQRMKDSGKPPVEPQNLMSMDGLEEMEEELVAHCDILERSGLVDYQMGVAEEEIVIMFHQCMHLLEDGEKKPENSGTIPGPPAPGTAAR